MSRTLHVYNDANVKQMRRSRVLVFLDAGRDGFSNKLLSMSSHRKTKAEFRAATGTLVLSLNIIQSFLLRVVVYKHVYMVRWI